MKLTYDEISPITGNLSVLIEYDDDVCIKFDIESGYTTREGWIDGTPQVEAFEFACPEHLKDTRFVDSGGQVWYKITLLAGDVMMYPDVYDGDSMWIVGKLRKLEDGELTDRFIQVREVDNKKIPYVFDTDLSTMFEGTDFQTAYDHFLKLYNEQFADV